MSEALSKAEAAIRGKHYQLDRLADALTEYKIELADLEAKLATETDFNAFKKLNARKDYVTARITATQGELDAIKAAPIVPAEVLENLRREFKAKNEEITKKIKADFIADYDRMKYHYEQNIKELDALRPAQRIIENCDPDGERVFISSFTGTIAPYISSGSLLRYSEAKEIAP